MNVEIEIVYVVVSELARGKYNVQKNGNYIAMLYTVDSIRPLDIDKDNQFTIIVSGGKEYIVDIPYKQMKQNIKSWQNQ